MKYETHTPLDPKTVIPNLHQVWARDWKTGEYIRPFYLEADSAEDAFDKAEAFRPALQVKSVFSPGDWCPEG
jgi:hypothetical protein